MTKFSGSESWWHKSNVWGSLPDAALQFYWLSAECCCYHFTWWFQAEVSNSLNEKSICNQHKSSGLLTFHSRDWKCGFWAKTWRLMPLVHISCLITKPLACGCACALFIALQLVNLLWRYIGEVTYSWNTKRHMGSVRSKGCVAPCTYSELDFAAAKCYNFTVYTLTANFF